MRAQEPATVRSRFSVSDPRFLALVILALALVIRLWDLTARSLWLDEAVEYWTATSPIRHLAVSVRDIIQDPPLYSFLLHFWMKPSNHEAWMRLLSVGFGMGSVAGTMVIGRRLHGVRTGLAAGFLMAILPTAIHYAQEVGQYAPMQCVLVWNIAALLTLVRDPGRGAFARWGLLAVAAVYTYYGAILTVAIPFACFLFEAIRRRDRVRITRSLWTLAGFVVLILPLVIFYIPSQLHRGPTENAFQPAMVHSFTQGIGDLGTALKITIAFLFTGWPCTAVSEWITIALFALLVLLVAPRERRFAAWIGATWAVYALIGWLHLFPFGFRHSLILLPLLVPFLAAAVASASRMRAVAGAVAFGLLCAVSLVSPTNRVLRERLLHKSDCIWPETEDIGPVTKYWAEHRSPEQPTYVYYAAAPAFAYYAERYTHEETARPPDWFLHCWRGHDAAWCREGGIYYGRWLRSMKPEEKAQSVFDTMNQVPDEFWFIMAHAQEHEQDSMGGMLREHFDFADQMTKFDAAAVLLKRRAD